ncbi:MAG: diguanylate cyclase [Campylobacterota bacterium]|nr:diguanylate cyclase [Campylobacterota bacterium]
MNRILIVEDNKTLAKLLAKKISSALDFEVDVAYQLSEAKLFLSKYKYFICLLDINLPDAPNGEVVDYVLSKGQHAIVLSGNIDKEFRKKMLAKNIIDYVNKGGVGDINYTINTIGRLQKNKKHKVLVVDDSMVFRKQMEGFLKNLFYKVYTVAHGEEAIGMLETHPDISLMITDYNMPVMNGLDLVYEVRKERSKDDLCIIAISSNAEEDINALFLKHGANDYINKPFSKEEFSCRVNNSIEALENIQTVTNHANRDFLTGLYNRRYFFHTMDEYIHEDENLGEKFAVGMLDIDNFKKINDTYGHETGDRVIIHLANILMSSTNYRDIVSRFGGEEFCVVLKNINRFSAVEIFDRLREEVATSVVFSDNKEPINFTISIGVSLYSEDNLEETINQADMMLYKAKNSGKNRVLLEQ